MLHLYVFKLFYSSPEDTDRIVYIESLDYNKAFERVKFLFPKFSRHEFLGVDL